MAKQKVYAVRKGKKTGVFTSWEECSASVSGFPGAEYKGFLTKEEAEACEAMTNDGYDVYFALLRETAIGSWPKFRSKFGY